MTIAFTPPSLPTADTLPKSGKPGARDGGDDMFALLLAGLGQSIAAQLETGSSRSTSTAAHSHDDDKRDPNEVPAFLPMSIAAPVTPGLPDLSGLKPRLHDAPGVPSRTVADAMPQSPAGNALHPADQGALAPTLAAGDGIATDKSARLEHHETARPIDDIASSDTKPTPTPASGLLQTLATSTRSDRAQAQQPMTTAQPAPQEHAAARDFHVIPAHHATRTPETASSVAQGTPAPHARTDMKADALTPRSEVASEQQPAPGADSSALVATQHAEPSVAAAPLPAVVATVAHSIGDSQWPAATARQIAQVVLSQRDRAEIRVHPADLGPIRIEVAMKAHEASVTLVAPVAQTRHALEQALPQLREMLAQGGITLGQANIHDGRGASSGGSWSAPHASTTSPVESNGESVVAAAGPPSVPTSRLIDTFA